MNIGQKKILKWMQKQNIFSSDYSIYQIIQTKWKYTTCASVEKNSCDIYNNQFSGHCGQSRRTVEACSILKRFFLAQLAKATWYPDCISAGG